MEDWQRKIDESIKKGEMEKHSDRQLDQNMKRKLKEIGDKLFHERIHPVYMKISKYMESKHNKETKLQIVDPSIGGGYTALAVYPKFRKPSQQVEGFFGKIGLDREFRYLIEVKILPQKIQIQSYHEYRFPEDLEKGSKGQIQIVKDFDDESLYDTITEKAIIDDFVNGWSIAMSSR